MTELEQKIILNSYDVFPIKFIGGIDVNSDCRNVYIKGGMDGVKLYEGGLDEYIPPIEDDVLLYLNTATSEPAGEENPRVKTLF